VSPLTDFNCLGLVVYNLPDKILSIDLTLFLSVDPHYSIISPVVVSQSLTNVPFGDIIYRWGHIMVLSDEPAFILQ
jgi:hypothetical protein